MKEQDLEKKGVTIRPFLHRNGSYYGQYWGYVVAHQNGHAKPTLYGVNSSGETPRIDPFSSRKKALKFAQNLAHDKDPIDPQELDLHEDSLWIDIGGEG